MADMLNVSISGLRAFQRALETTSHNIANVATPGYSRQAVLLGTSQPEIFGRAALGTGVAVQGVRRFSDELLSLQMRQASSTFSRTAAYAEKANALANLFADSSTGLSVSLQKFTNALQEVANTPTSTAARQVLLSEAQSLATRLKTYESRLSALDAQINEQLRAEAATINGIARNIAELNQEIMRARSSTGSPPADLLDARDRQLAMLAERLDTTIVRQDDSTINVFVGNGQPLVLGNVPAELVAQADPFQPDRVSLAFRTSGGTVDISSSLSGGSIGGLLDARRELIDPARNELGRMAVALAEVTNAQHRRGVDLHGDAGGDFFGVGAVEVLPSRTNDGNAVLDVSRTGASALTTHDYVLRQEGGSWTVRRADTGAAVPSSISGSGALEFDGLSVQVSGTAADGDQFLIRPTAGAVSGLSVLVSDPSRIAAAAPVRSAAATGNAGTATISAGEVLDAEHPGLLGSVTIRFTDAGTWEARDAADNVLGGGAYVPGGSIEFNGWRVRIDGVPAAGDSFTVTANTGGVGDNRNVLAMAEALSRGVLSGGTESLDTAVSRFVGQVGVAAASANATLEAQQIVYEDSLAAVDSLSGVNLDEEAANLLRFQQAYQAAAQMIRVTQELMDTLMNAVRR
jgi:flagellar hook-associated protein 1 FlgK